MPNLNQYLLSDNRLLKPLEEQLLQFLKGSSLVFDQKIVMQIVYAAWQKRRFYWTDQVFHSHWQQLEDKSASSHWSSVALNQAANFYFGNDNRFLSIKSERFGDWQQWVANQSGLPVAAQQLANQLDTNCLQNPVDLIAKLKQFVGRRALFSPHYNLVEDYIQNEGLHEVHMHLNGTTLVEHMWNQTLKSPSEFIGCLSNAANKSERVKLLYTSAPFLGSPVDIARLLQIARLLRELILCWLNENDTAERKVQLKRELERDAPAACNFFYEHQLFEHCAPQWTHVYELSWQVRLLYKFKAKREPLFDIAYLLYLVSMNSFHGLLVQRDDQYGFEQFQKFADDGARDVIEQSYQNRFFQLHGSKLNGRPDLSTLEGRFAPKGSAQGNRKLIESILVGFLEYAEGYKVAEHSDDLNGLAQRIRLIKRPKFRLVAHFIKRPWTCKSESGYHFQSVRDDLHHKAFLLIELLENNPHLKSVITGVDAAANELETPPEVLASVYRYCRSRGMVHFTYHVGEDFIHLLNGIRVVYDAVTLLDLKNGDRIGHATAIGILPKVWRENMPEKIHMQRGQWLDCLLFLRKIALISSDMSYTLQWIDSQIRATAQNIPYFREVANFDICNPDVIELLQESYEFRGLHPAVLCSSGLIQSKGPSPDEYDYVTEMEIRPSVNSLKLLYERFYDAQILLKHEEIIEIDLHIISDDMLLKAQQFVQREIAKRVVVIETLPTSNVRISHYQHVRQHHVFRWMQLPERSQVGDVKMVLALGSDDPGIFATDMRNEFYHLFTTLINDFKLSTEQALKYVAEINENGRVYRFDGPNFEMEKSNKRGLAEY